MFWLVLAILKSVPDEFQLRYRMECLQRVGCWSYCPIYQLEIMRSYILFGTTICSAFLLFIQFDLINLNKAYISKLNEQLYCSMAQVANV